MVFGTSQRGAFVTFDGGSTWTKSNGFGAAKEKVNVFNAVVSPADGQFVWAMGLNLAQADAGDPTQGRHIYLSTDGGKNFSSVIDHNSNVTLINGPTMAPHLKDPNVLYFVFGTNWGVNPGTDLYKYDHNTPKVTKEHNHYDDIEDIQFSPANASVIYLGVAFERKGPH
jgi:hypothetical protein